MVNTITKGIHKVIQRKGVLQYEEKYDHMHFQRIRQWRKRGRTAVIQEAWNSFYDKEILARVAEESDMSEEFVKNHEENAVYSHIINVPIGHRFPGVDTEEIMTPEKLFMIQAHVIHELAAENESCIFVGRCADVVLRSRKLLQFLYPQSSRRTD